MSDEKLWLDGFFPAAAQTTERERETVSSCEMRVMGCC